MRRADLARGPALGEASGDAGPGGGATAHAVLVLVMAIEFAVTAA